MRLEQRVIEAHSPIRNPVLTEEAEGKIGLLDDILEIGDRKSVV